jgi:hypothetical protein
MNILVELRARKKQGRSDPKAGQGGDGEILTQATWHASSCFYSISPWSWNDGRLMYPLLWFKLLLRRQRSIKFGVIQATLRIAVKTGPPIDTEGSFGDLIKKQMSKNK